MLQVSVIIKLMNVVCSVRFICYSFIVPPDLAYRVEYMLFLFLLQWEFWSAWHNCQNFLLSCAWLLAWLTFNSYSLLLSSWRYLEGLQDNPDMDRTETLGQFIKTRNFSELFQKAYLVRLLKLFPYAFAC